MVCPGLLKNYPNLYTVFLYGIIKNRVLISKNKGIKIVRREKHYECISNQLWKFIFEVPAHQL